MTTKDYLFLVWFVGTFTVGPVLAGLSLYLFVLEDQIFYHPRSRLLILVRNALHPFSFLAERNKGNSHLDYEGMLGEIFGLGIYKTGKKIYLVISSIFWPVRFCLTVFGTVWVLIEILISALTYPFKTKEED